MQSRKAALADGDLHVSEHVSPQAVAASMALDDEGGKPVADDTMSMPADAPSASAAAASLSAAEAATRRLFRSSPPPASAGKAPPK